MLKLNSVLAKIIINSYNLRKSIEILKEIKNNKILNESNYSEIYMNFINIINKNNIQEEENIQLICIYLLKNINNNFLVFDSIEDGKYNMTDDSFVKIYKIFLNFYQKFNILII